jgi:hypothetical protein
LRNSKMSLDGRAYPSQMKRALWGIAAVQIEQ